MKTMQRFRGERAAVLAALLLLPCAIAQAQDLKIDAAANLQSVLTDALIPAFEKASHATVTPTFGSTKQLAIQIENGQVADVFLSADVTTVTKLTTEGLLDPATAHVYAIGRLVMWARQDAAKHPRRIEDLNDPAYTKISIANPALAPYGLAAQQSFASAGLTASITPRLVQAANIGECLQMAKSGNADVALTALSLVIDDKTDPYVIVPDKLHDPIAQSLAVAKTPAQPQLAAQFVAFLKSKDAKDIWKRYGYKLP